MKGLFLVVELVWMKVVMCFLFVLLGLVMSIGIGVVVIWLVSFSRLVMVFVLKIMFVRL